MEEREHITVQAMLEAALHEKKLTPQRLAEQTDIPERYIEALVQGEQKGLPPAPYVRGYLMRIAQTLGIDGQELWQVYRRQTSLRTSGEADKLPSNRFALKRASRMKVATIAGVIVAIALGAMVLSRITGMADIEIKNPSDESVTVKESSIDLRGRIDPTAHLMINNEDVAVDKGGYFEKKFSLEPGINSVEFKVKRVLGKERVVTRQIFYQQ